MKSKRKLNWVSYEEIKKVYKEGNVVLRREAVKQFNYVYHYQTLVNDSLSFSERFVYLPVFNGSFQIKTYSYTEAIENISNGSSVLIINGSLSRLGTCKWYICKFMNPESFLYYSFRDDRIESNYLFAPLKS